MHRAADEGGSVRRTAAALGIALVGLALGLALAAPARAGADLWVDATGGRDDTGDGSRAAPFASIAAANRAAASGDVIHVRGGPQAYAEEIRPDKNGLTYRGEGRPVVVGDGARQCIDLKAVRDTAVRGFRCDGGGSPATAFNLFVRFSSATANVVEDNVFVGRITGSGLLLTGSDSLGHSRYNRIVGNFIDPVMPASRDFQTLALHPGSRRNLIEGNEVRTGDHNTLQIRSSMNVVRNNRFVNPRYRILEISSTGSDRGSFNVIEGNELYGSRNSTNASQVWSPDNIFRGNRFTGSQGVGLRLADGGVSLSGNRVYGNVFFDNGKSTGPGSAHYEGLRVTAQSFPSHDIRIVNNVFFRNFRGVGTQLRLEYGSGINGTTVLHNALRSDVGDPVPFALISVLGDRPDHSVGSFEAAYGAPGRVAGNREVLDPRFRDTSRRAAADLRPRADSPLVDAGAWLTHVTADVTDQQTVPLEDVRFFSDGNGVVEGDWVRFAGSGEFRQVQALDRSANTATLSQPVSAAQGEGVALPWQGSAPDIGAFEWTHVVDEDFEGYAPGADPTNPGDGDAADWLVGEAPGTNALRVLDAGPPHGQVLAVDDAGTAQWSLNRDFAPRRAGSARPLVVQRLALRFRDVAGPSRGGLFLSDNGRHATFVEFDFGGAAPALRARTGAGVTTLVEPVQAGVWYAIEVTADLDAGTWDVLVTDQEAGQPAGGALGLAFFDRVTRLDRSLLKSFGSGPASRAALDVDDVEVEALSYRPW